jgi:hypothetical protein
MMSRTGDGRHIRIVILFIEFILVVQATTLPIFFHIGVTIIVIIRHGGNRWRRLQQMYRRPRRRMEDRPRKPPRVCALVSTRSAPAVVSRRMNVCRCSEAVVSIMSTHVRVDVELPAAVGIRTLESYINQETRSS